MSLVDPRLEGGGEENSTLPGRTGQVSVRPSEGTRGAPAPSGAPMRLLHASLKLSRAVSRPSRAIAKVSSVLPQEGRVPA